MKKIISYYVASIIMGANIFGQDTLLPIALKITNPGNKPEFSAMSWKGTDTLFILKQRKTKYFSYALRNEINKSLSNQTEFKLHSIPVTGLDIFSENLGKYKTNKGMELVYDGIESCVFTGDKAIVSIETPLDYCYILVGIYNGTKFVFDPEKYLKLPKPYRCEYGYENLIMLPKNFFLTVFETAKDSINHKGYIFSNIMTDTMPVIISCSNYRKNNGRELRLSEICFYKDKLLGIDFDRNKTTNECYSKIVVLSNIEKKIDAKIVGYLNYNTSSNANLISCINFEGMAEFDDGVLVISDDWPPNGGQTYLYFYQLDNLIKGR